MCLVVRLRALLVLCALAAVGVVGSRSLEPEASVPTALVEVIRRQLMENNYDYMLSETEEAQYEQHRRQKTVTSKRLFRARDDSVKDRGTQGEPEQVDDDRQDELSGASYQSIRAQNNAEHINRAHEDAQLVDRTTGNPTETPKHTTHKEDKQIRSLLHREIYNIKNSREVHKNDLLYYVSDDHFRRADVDGDRESSEEQEPTTTTVQYKVFTVKAGGGDGRRRGSTSASGRVFVREQRPGEVVLLRLDDQPFPEFRLPAARRQYMDAQGPAVD